MDRSAIVALSRKSQMCNQNDLATLIGVTSAELAAWKAGRDVSQSAGDLIEQRLRTLAGIGDRSPSVVLAAGSIHSADKWATLIHELAKDAEMGAETGYSSYPLEDDLGLLVPSVFSILKDIGATIPTNFPTELETAALDEECLELRDPRNENPYFSFIQDIFETTTDISGFYAAYVEPVLDQIDVSAHKLEDFEPCLLLLAAARTDVDETFAPKIGAFRADIIDLYRGMLLKLKEVAFQMRIPLKAELMDLIYAPTKSVGACAERESLGFNDTRIHPDLYTNEVIVGMRLLHQVLPKIIEKLGIDFVLDEDDLHNVPNQETRI